MDIAENPIPHVTLVLLGVIASVFDLKWRVLPDWLTVGGMALGLALAGILHGWSGLGAAAVGMGVGLFTFWVFWTFGMMGSGDVLFMGTCGALLGWPLILLGLLYSTVAGALFGVGLAVARGSFRRVFANLWIAVTSTFRSGKRRVPLAELPTEELPYAVGIAVGSALAALAAYVPALQLG
jgi:Flp pilus assembly protein protease CpaA